MEAPEAIPQEVVIQTLKEEISRIWWSIEVNFTKKSQAQNLRKASINLKIFPLMIRTSLKLFPRMIQIARNRSFLTLRKSKSLSKMNKIKLIRATQIQILRKAAPIRTQRKVTLIRITLVRMNFYLISGWKVNSLQIQTMQILVR